METDAGDWTDRSFADVQAEAPELFEEFFTGAPSFAFPGGESFARRRSASRRRCATSKRARCRRSSSATGWSSARRSLSRGGEWLPNGQRVLNGAIVPLDPAAAGRRAERGGRGRDSGELAGRAKFVARSGDERSAFAGHTRTRDDEVETGSLGALTCRRVHVRIEAQGARLTQQALRRKRFHERRTVEIPIHQVDNEHRR